VEFWKIRRRFALNSASDWNGTPSSRAFSLMTDSERFKATEARNAEAPDAMSAFSRSASLSDHTFFLGTTSCSHASRARSRTPEMFYWFLRAGVRPTVARYLLERAMCDGPQSAQGDVSLLRTELQFLRDVATAFVVAAVGKDAAGFFENEVHVCNRPIIQSGHGATFPSTGAETTSFASDRTVSMIANSGKSGTRIGTRVAGRHLKRMSCRIRAHVKN
jgi:hypothetical protein